MSERRTGRISLFDRWIATVPAEDAARLASVPVVQADNVAAYMFSHMRGWRFSDGVDFPNLAPTFPLFWVEFRSPDASFIKRHGMLVAACDVGGDLVRMGLSTEDGSVLRWMLMFQNHVLEGHDGRLLENPLGAWLAVDTTGTARKCWHRGEFGTLRIIEMPGVTADCDDSTARMLGGELANCVGVAALSLCFMHCKNVVTEAIRRDEKLSRAWRRRHGRPLVRHHVLNIDPMKRVLRTEGRSDEVGLPQALHICRGHFKTYTPEHPLFGRTTGTFWWPMTVRGNPAAGIVTKDYRIGAPAIGA